MNLPTFIRTHSLSNSLLFGFYGGGNYGDELLLETISNILHAGGHTNISVAYQSSDTFKMFHHDFGYSRVPMHNKLAIFKTILAKKQIIVGGGGLWGLDTNLNVFLLSLLLFISRKLLGKRVYLLNVGYYNSASRLGRISAWLAGKAANTILARDDETYRNFQRISHQVHQDTDMAWYIPHINLSAYADEAADLANRLPITGKTIYITVRRFKPDKPNQFNKAVATFVANNPNKHIILALMEPEHVDPQGYTMLHQLRQQHPNLTVTDFSFNPLALFLFFKEHAKQLIYIGPQFHGIITAHLNDIPFLPISYDNKVDQLLQAIGSTHIHPLHQVTAETLQSFVNKHA